MGNFGFMEWGTGVGVRKISTGWLILTESLIRGVSSKILTEFNFAFRKILFEELQTLWGVTEKRHSSSRSVEVFFATSGERSISKLNYNINIYSCVTINNFLR